MLKLFTYFITCEYELIIIIVVMNNIIITSNNINDINNKRQLIPSSELNLLLCPRHRCRMKLQSLKISHSGPPREMIEDLKEVCGG